MEKTGTIEDSKNSDEKQKAVAVKEGKGKKKGGKGNSATKDSSAKRQAKVEKDLQAQVCLIRAFFFKKLNHCKYQFLNQKPEKMIEISIDLKTLIASMYFIIHL